MCRGKSGLGLIKPSIIDQLLVIRHVTAKFDYLIESVVPYCTVLYCTDQPSTVQESQKCFLIGVIKNCNFPASLFPSLD